MDSHLINHNPNHPSYLHNQFGADTSLSSIVQPNGWGPNDYQNTCPNELTYSQNSPGYGTPNSSLLRYLESNDENWNGMSPYGSSEAGYRNLPAYISQGSPNQNYREILTNAPPLASGIHLRDIEGPEVANQLTRGMRNNNRLTAGPMRSPRALKSKDILRSHPTSSPTSSIIAAGGQSPRAEGNRRSSGGNGLQLTPNDMDALKVYEHSQKEASKEWFLLIKNVLSVQIAEGRDKAKHERFIVKRQEKCMDESGERIKELSNHYFCPDPDCAGKAGHKDATELARHWGCKHVATSNLLNEREDVRRKLIQLQTCPNPECRKVLSRPDSTNRHYHVSDGKTSCFKRRAQKEYPNYHGDD